VSPTTALGSSWDLERLGYFVFFFWAGHATRATPHASITSTTLSWPLNRIVAPSGLSQTVQYGMVWVDGFWRPSSSSPIGSPALPASFSSSFAAKIRSGALPRGERLPATRELAGLLGLNRTTVSAAYEMLESEGLIAGQVGPRQFRDGAFDGGALRARRGRLEFSAGAQRYAAPGTFGGRPLGPAGEVISFVMSRPSHALFFPLDEFRASCAAVLARQDLAGILQLGSPRVSSRYGATSSIDARRQRLAGPGDDLIVTNGCQAGARPHRPRHAAARRHGSGGRPCLPGPEEPAGRNGVQLVGISGGRGRAGHRATGARVGTRATALAGGDLEFPEPHGRNPAMAARRELLEAARAAHVPVVENDAYGELRYEGEPLPAIKQLDENGGHRFAPQLFQGEFSGLRVGWVVGRTPDRPLRQAKEAADLHTDQLSQAVLLEFRGNPDAWRPPRARAPSRRRAAGGRRWTPAAGVLFCRPNARWTRPQGRHERVGAVCPSPWMRVSFCAAQKEGVSLSAGRYFAVSRLDPGALRLSFAGLTPDQIRSGLSVLGRIVSAEIESASGSFEPASADGVVEQMCIFGRDHV